MTDKITKLNKRGIINNSVLKDIMGFGVSRNVAMKIVIAASRGTIKHLSINYGGKNE